MFAVVKEHQTTASPALFVSSYSLLQLGRGIQYILSMMRKCIMAKVGISKKMKTKENRGVIYLFEMGEYAICIFGFGDWTPL